MCFDWSVSIGVYWLHWAAGAPPPARDAGRVPLAPLAPREHAELDRAWALVKAGRMKRCIADALRGHPHGKGCQLKKVPFYGAPFTPAQELRRAPALCCQTACRCSAEHAGTL
jgi:hypothetical protein